MRVVSLAAAALAAVPLVAAPLATDAQEYSYAIPARVLTTVDAVSSYGDALLITGVVRGEAAPSTWLLDGGSDAIAVGLASTCQRSALLAMSKPGQYLLEVYSGTSTNRGYCKLILRVNP